MPEFFEQRKAETIRRAGYQAPAHHDRHWAREQQLVTQRNLLERLRYKGYVRRGTLSCFMQRLGDWGRRNFMYVVAMRWWR